VQKNNTRQKKKNNRQSHFFAECLKKHFAKKVFAECREKTLANDTLPSEKKKHSA
jgi:hypothetical protein